MKYNEPMADSVEIQLLTNIEIVVKVGKGLRPACDLDTTENLLRSFLHKHREAKRIEAMNDEYDPPNLVKEQAS